ncbi:hypothetical protein WJX74_004614, partial [Apatococcus lobatus]
MTTDWVECGPNDTDTQSGYSTRSVHDCAAPASSCSVSLKPLTVLSKSYKQSGPILRTEEGQSGAMLCTAEESPSSAHSAASEYQPGAACQEPVKGPVWSVSSYDDCKGVRDEGLNSHPITAAQESSHEADSPGTTSFLMDGFSEADSAETETVYTKDGVAIFPAKAERIMGRLSLLKLHRVLFFSWLPHSHGSVNEDGLFQESGDPHCILASRDQTMYAVHPIALSEVKAIRKHTSTFASQHIVIILQNGLTLPPFYFNNGGVKALFAALKQHANLVKSAGEADTYLINDLADPLQRSLHSLDLLDIPRSAPLPAAAPGPHSPPPTSASCMLSPKGPWQLAATSTPPAATSATAGSHIGSTVVEHFQRVRQLACNTTSSIFAGSVLMQPAAAAGPGMPVAPQPLAAHLPPPAPLQLGPSPIAVARKLLASRAASEAGIPSLTPTPTPDALGRRGLKPSPSYSQNGQQQRSRMGTTSRPHPHSPHSVQQSGDCRELQRSSSGEAASCLGSFELIELQGRGLDAAHAGSPVLRTRPPPLSREEWATFFSPSDGHLVDEKHFRKRVFYSGIALGVRREAWKFLLGIYSARESSKERQVRMTDMRAEYEKLKSQWTTITGPQETRFGKWRERRNRVDKDVQRTDRSHPTFADTTMMSPSITALRNILLTYGQYNFDLGYCQGMSDLAAPMLVVMKDEAEAFWCFAALMDRLEGNFHSDSQGMHAQLTALRDLLDLLDPPLYAHLASADALSFFFAYRWLLIHFKREFAFDE